MFAAAVDTWFREHYAAPTPAQARGWPCIAAGNHTLIVAPTGSGKTLAAFLYAIDRCMRLPPQAQAGVRVLYISPLKALVYDVERNLRAPLAGIRASAERLGTPLRPVRVDVRTGDTPAHERRAQARHPGEILVTTPESLFLLLGSQARETLRTVHTVIVDEVHALLPTKRGVHLSLSLERLAAITEGEPQRIGLSATVRPLAEAAGFLGGDRPVEIIDTAAPPALDLTVTVPVPDMERVAMGVFDPGAPPPAERGLWMAVYPALLAEIRTHRSTLVFVNSRGLCERLTARINELAGEELVRAHHGSVSHEQRAIIEEDLKQGRLRGIVATSSLELGIDMGAIDLVVQIESPGAVARGLQRVGRAGHAVGETSVGRIYPKFRADLLECAVVAQRMRRGAIEAVSTPVNVLDVLAQQVIAICADTPRRRADIAALVRRAWPYRTLTPAALDAVLHMLTGGYPSGDFADLRPLLAWDKASDIIDARRGSAMLSRLNVGTIPDRGLYTVQIGSDGPRLGELDEEMVFESKKGDVILLGASAWRIEEITRDRVHVSPAPGEAGRLPFWHGEGPGRPRELGLAVGAFLREVSDVPAKQRAEWLQAHLPLDEFAAGNLAAYVEEQQVATGVLPTDRVIVVERFRDELGDWRVCILSPFGARVHAPWAMALQSVLGAREGYDVQLMHTDDGLVLRFADVDALPSLAALLPPAEEAERLVTEQLPNTALFAALFRENAARALLMPRRTGAGRRPLWAQRLKAQQLLATVQRYPDFPIVLETYRQALSDVFDMAGLKRLLTDIRARRVHVHEVETPGASPFARALVFAYVANYLYAGDAPLAERKAQALTLDRHLLAELLGQEELRELIDPLALAELEAELQHLAPGQRARDANELHDLLRRLGDLTAAEIAARADHSGFVDQLLRQQRATTITLPAGQRFIAAEDAAVYRDALGITPAHVPEVSHPEEHPRAALLRRYARTHGPFCTDEAARRFALAPADVETDLRELQKEGVLVLGEIRPDGMQPEWCDAEVLRRLRRRTLARLRRTVAPVDARTLGRFLPGWQHLHGERAGTDALRAAIVQLEGLALPWSLLGNVVLPARVPDFRFDHLDLLAATGEVVWIGSGALGARDGRVILMRRTQAPRLLEKPADTAPDDPLQRAILDHLAARGACFLAELEQSALRSGLEPTLPELTAALWDLVWAGQITNDTFAPLRALASGAARHPRRHGPSAVGGRWSRIADLHGRAVTPTERTVARVEMLLERYGVVSREAALAEGIPGGFGPLYQVLKEMEASGRVRRGYFVEGLSGLQFARAGVVDRLRAERPGEPLVEYGELDAMLLAVLDPANPYGTLLPWPVTGAAAATPRRVPGAWIVLVDGAPALYLSADGRQLLTFPSGYREEPSGLAAAVRLLHRLPRGARRRMLVIERIDDTPARASPHAPALMAAGFAADYKGLSQ